MPRPRHFPIVTIGAVTLNVIVFMLILEGQLSFDESLSASLERHWVYLISWNIWSGGYWSLLTASFVHVDFFPFQSVFHMLIDLMGLWVFGRRVEMALGSTALFALMFFGALVGSATSLAVGAWPGLGCTPMSLAAIGLMLAARRRYRPFAELFIVREHARFMLGWLLAVSLASLAGIVPVHNAAHLAGWLFGWMAGRLFLTSAPRAGATIGLAALALLTVVSVTWMPWDADWTLWRFDKQIRAGRTEIAMREIQPLLDAEAPSPDALNIVAWILATSRRDEARNGELAVELARRACMANEWRDVNHIDTLAAAYAETGEWEKALHMQRQAVRAASESGLYSMEARAIFDNNLRSIEERRKIRD
jgi:membrane associated rhomboid family serine protease